MTHQQELSDIIRLEMPATFKYLSMLGACLDEVVAHVKNLEVQDIV